MFQALSTPLAFIDVGPARHLPVATGFDLMAVSLIGFTGARFFTYRGKYEAAADTSRKNAMTAGYDEAQQSLNWALGIGAALVVVPRVLKAVMK